MPYKIVKSDEGYKVAKKKGGKTFSKKPISKKKAEAQMRAMYANESLQDFQQLLENALEDDYRGQHRAPGRDSGAPLYDLTKLYPDDIYGPDAARYYGDGSNINMDQYVVSIMRSLRNRPNGAIKIYRAIPKILTNEEKRTKYYKEKAYIQKRGKMPPTSDEPNMNVSKYYEYAQKMLDSLPENIKDSKIKINKGDWVTISRQYAIDHGEAALRGKYRILSKTVRAKDLYTDADSLYEFGYDPV